MKLTHLLRPTFELLGTQNNKSGSFTYKEIEILHSVQPLEMGTCQSFKNSERVENTAKFILLFFSGKDNYVRIFSRLLAFCKQFEGLTLC